MESTEPFQERVLVTGANGFVGRVLCGRLWEAGFELRGAVRQATHSQEEWPLFPVGEVGPETDWTAALEGVRSVVHLAARVHVIDERAHNPLAEFRRVNLAGTKHLARMAANAGVRRLVYISSIGVNGKTTRSQAFTEEDPPAPHNPYSVSKWEAEQALHRISADTGLEVVILRPPLMYGPGVKANFLRLMKLVDKGIPLPLGSADNRRSLLYVRNLTDAIITCIRRSEAAGQTFLVSDGEDVSTADLIQRIAGALGRPSRLLPFPPALLQIAGRLAGKSALVEQLLGSLVVDSSKIRRVLGWEPPYTMAEGLKETADWFRGRASR